MSFKKKFFIRNLAKKGFFINLLYLTFLFLFRFGEVIDCVVMKNAESGRSRGFGFVTFSDEKEADEAIAKLNEHELNGRKIVVNEARPPRENR